MMRNLLPAMNMAELMATATLVGLVSTWLHGIYICWKSNDHFLVVSSFAFPPLGIGVGIYNLIFRKEHQR